MDLYQKLDNPVWNCLKETQAGHSIDFGSLKCYDPSFTPFGGFVHRNGGTRPASRLALEIDQYAEIINDFFIVGEKPLWSDRINLKHELLTYQMILRSPSPIRMNAETIKLNDSHKKELFDLVNLVQPGYFRERTAELGDYYGIFSDGKLVSVTGERMQMDHLIEISAVVTHPDHVGKGYAKQLTGLVANKIFSKNKRPFLHVSVTNEIAIGLYKSLGFEIRRQITFWHFEKP